MKRIIVSSLTALLIIGISSCLLKKKSLEIVLTEESCADFSEMELLASFITPAEVNFGRKLDDLLTENGMSRSDISRAVLVSVSYGITQFSHDHDWSISGIITVERKDKPEGPFPILTYANVSLERTLGVMVPADLDSSGVNLVNRALADFISGDDPILVFTVQNGDVDPLPSLSDPIAFDWKACAVMHVVVRQNLEVPDPF